MLASGHIEYENDRVVEVCILPWGYGLWATLIRRDEVVWSNLIPLDNHIQPDIYCIPFQNVRSLWE